MSMHKLTSPNDAVQIQEKKAASALKSIGNIIYTKAMEAIASVPLPVALVP